MSKTKAVIKLAILPFGFGGTLALIFTVAKIWGYIDWSWWLVLLPAYWGVATIMAILIGIIAIGLVALIIIGIIWGCVILYEWYDKPRREKRRRESLRQRFDARRPKK
jgi:uncharacterized membrane protein